MQNTELLKYDAFYIRFRSCNPLETDYTDYVNLLKSGLTTEQAVVKLKLSKLFPTGIENYQYLQRILKQEQMSFFMDFFLRWYDNKDVVPTIEAMEKKIVFYHDKDIDMLKLGCTLPNLANICLHKSTDAKFYPFTEGDKHRLEKIREAVVGGPSVVFARKAVVDETFIRKSTNLYKSIAGIDASQLYPFSMCQPMPTGLYRRWDFDSETSRFIPRPPALKIWSCLFSNEQDQNVKSKTSLQQADRRKLTASVLMDFVLIATLCLKPWVDFITSALVRTCVPVTLKRIFHVVAKRERSMH